MAGHRRFEPAAERGAVDGGYYQLGPVFDAVEYGIQAGAAAAVATRGNLSELPNVGPGDKGSTGANQHNRLYPGLFFKLLYSSDNALRHSRAKGVDWGVVDGQDANFAISADFD